MTPRVETNTPVQSGQVSHDSPKVHPAGVKLGNAKNSVNIEKKKNSLSSFTFSPVPPPARAYVCARVTRGESWESCPGLVSPGRANRSPTLARVGVVARRWPVHPPAARTRPWATRWPTPRGAKLAGESRPVDWRIGTSRETGQAAGRGNGAEPKQSLFSLSEHS